MRAASALFAIAAIPLFGADVYFNDFNGPVGTTFPEWTSSGYIYSSNKAGTVAAGSGPQGVATVASPNGKQLFLGEFGGPAIVTAPPYDPQHFVRVDETVTLTLNGLAPHTLATVSFDLHVLKSWDGNNTNYGPDRWSLSVRGGDRLLNTTFSNNPKTGDYDVSQQNHPIANSSHQTGAAAVNTLGYTFYGDSTYHLTFTFAHTGGTLMLDFSSSLFEGKGTDDESWGLDNVRVSINADGPIAVSGGPGRDTSNSKSASSPLVQPRMPVLGGQPQRWLANAEGLTWSVGPAGKPRVVFSEMTQHGFQMSIVTSTESRGDQRTVYAPPNDGMAHRSRPSPRGDHIIVAARCHECLFGPKCQTSKRAVPAPKK